VALTERVLSTDSSVGFSLLVCLYVCICTPQFKFYFLARKLNLPQAPNTTLLWGHAQRTKCITSLCSLAHRTLKSDHPRDFSRDRRTEHDRPPHSNHTARIATCTHHQNGGWGSQAFTMPLADLHPIVSTSYDVFFPAKAPHKGRRRVRTRYQY
jgi:hypothetical protein